MIKKWLARSRNQACDVRLTLHQNKSGAVFISAPTILQPIAPHLRSLELQIELVELRKCLDFVAHGLPQLEELCIELEGGDNGIYWGVGIVDLDLSSCPKLKSVILSKPIVEAVDDLQNAMPESLEKFYIVDGDPIWMQPDEMLDILLKCRNLKSFSVNSMANQRWGGGIPLPSGLLFQLSHTSLRVLDIAFESPFDGVRPLFQAVQFPSLVDLDLGCIADAPGILGLVADASPPLKSLALWKCPINPEELLDFFRRIPTVIKIKIKQCGCLAALMSHLTLSPENPSLSSMRPLPTYSQGPPILVLGIDVGTTFSGVALCMLTPGKTPVIHHVMQWPGQRANEHRVPSIVYYDRDGAVAAVGAQAITRETSMEAQQNGWLKAEWFKLHLKPVQLDSDDANFRSKLPQLPPGKTATMIFSDFLHYLYAHTRKFTKEFRDTTRTFLAANPKIVVVLTHPNGWEGPQQMEMRKAAILAGIVSEREDVYFVSEGEAGLQYCVHQELCNDSNRILIVDAGGGTVDVSGYDRKDATPNYEPSYDEVIRPECHLQGGVIVTSYAFDYIQNHLQMTTHVQYIDTLTRDFDNTGKQNFTPDSRVVCLNTGNRDINDADKKIWAGVLVLTGDE